MAGTKGKVQHFGKYDKRVNNNNNFSINLIFLKLTCISLCTNFHPNSQGTHFLLLFKTIPSFGINVNLISEINKAFIYLYSAHQFTL